MTTIDDQAAPIAIPIRPDETKAERNERLRLLAGTYRAELLARGEIADVNLIEF